MDPRNYKEEKCKKKNILMEAGKETERNTNASEKIVCTTMQKEVTLSSLQNKEEKEMKRLFHINIKIKKNKVDALFDFGS
jgi:hypothetical protein